MALSSETFPSFCRNFTILWLAGNLLCAYRSYITPRNPHRGPRPRAPNIGPGTRDHNMGRRTRDPNMCHRTRDPTRGPTRGHRTWDPTRDPTRGHRTFDATHALHSGVLIKGFTRHTRVTVAPLSALSFPFACFSPLGGSHALFDGSHGPPLRWTTDGVSPRGECSGCLCGMVCIRTDNSHAPERIWVRGRFRGVGLAVGTTSGSTIGFPRVTKNTKAWGLQSQVRLVFRQRPIALGAVQPTHPPLASSQPAKICACEAQLCPQDPFPPER